MSESIDYNSYLIFNPEGKIKQLEYIKNSADLGNTCLALCNDKYGVMIAHVPLRSKLAESQDKIFKINENSLFSFAGITNDGLEIVNYLRRSSLEEDVIKDRSIHYVHSFYDLCVDAANRTLVSSSRLYGVSGMLLMDYEGIKLVEFVPTGLISVAVGVSIGNRSQSCKTILENECENFSKTTADELINIGIRALYNANPDPAEGSLKSQDVQIYLVESGKGITKVDSSLYVH
ncbi:MAG: hypothetical protein KC414_15075 [Romboutsia sp.]|nr:hypothetical protein [Romboutsia sp.]